MALGLLLLPSGASAQQPTILRQATDVIELWKPDQHLYVKGNLGVSSSQLDALEAWLDANGPRWTVVLLQDAEGEAFRTADGRMFRDMDAVRYALGQGLSNRTGFGKLEHPRTGETDGCIFVLFLRERKFSYFGSEAQDRRNLGEDHWIGELDRPAYRAMRSGGRIIDAVQDTVTQINSKLEQAIATESEAAEAQQRERQRSREQVLTELSHLRELVASAKTEAAAFKQQFPQAEGQLAAPPIAAWTRTLDTVAQEMNDSNVRDMQAQLGGLRAEVSGLLGRYALSNEFDELSGHVQDGIRQVESRLSSLGLPGVPKASELLEAAAAARKQGDPTFVDRLDEAGTEVEAAETRAQEEDARLEQVAARKRLVRRTAATTLGGVSLAGLCGLFYLNRRRVPVLQRTLKEFASREKVVRGEMDQVLSVFGRASEVLGDRQKVEARGYEGLTRKLVDQAFGGVDELLVMSNEVSRVMKEARGILYPASPVNRLKNLFSAESYERGLNHISGEPVRFHENQGIPAILRKIAKSGPPPEGNSAANDEEVSLTFEEVFSAFHERGKGTAETLDRVENALRQLPARLAEVQAQFDEATRLEKELDTANDQDGFFVVDNFFAKFLPAIREELTTAESRAISDPVLAVEQLLPAIAAKLGPALELARSLQRARAEVFPKFNEHAPKLKQRGYDTRWISAAIQTAGARANELFQVRSATRCSSRASSAAATSPGSSPWRIST
jgi:hypothetical protein